MRSSVVVIVVFALGICFRGLWWPTWFQSAARHSLSQYDSDEALAWLDWATFLAPEDGETAFLRARAYRRLGDLNRSRAAIKRALLLKAPKERLEREEWFCDAQAGQLEKVEQYLHRIWNDPRGDVDEIRESLFLGCIVTKRHTDALEILETWISDRPKLARPYLQRARFWELKSKSSQAIEDLHRAIELEPKNPEAAVELATILERRNEFELAIPLFERGVKVPRLAVRSLVGLASCLNSVGQTRRVRSLLDEALKIAPDSPQALCESGRHDLETGHYADAVTKLTRAVRNAPHDETSHFVLAQALAAEGSRDEAKKQFEFVQTARDDWNEMNRCEELLGKNPRNVDALVLSGSIQLRGSDPEDGVARLLAALSIEPSHGAARKLLADYFTRRAETNPEYRRFAERFRDP